MPFEYEASMSRLRGEPSSERVLASTRSHAGERATLMYSTENASPSNRRGLSVERECSARGGTPKRAPGCMFVGRETVLMFQCIRSGLALQ